MKYDKNYLRKKFLLQRKKKYLSPERFNFNLIFNLIRKHFSKKKIIIGAYFPSNYEVDIFNFIEKAAKKKFKIALPVVTSSVSMLFKLWIFRDPLKISKFGILEPNNNKKETLPDFVMVPLVAFDKNLNRIGYGKGYYDRSLKKIKKTKIKTIFVGIAHSFQKCKNIPTNKHDIKLDYIFTEKGIISSNK